MRVFLHLGLCLSLTMYTMCFGRCADLSTLGEPLLSDSTSYIVGSLCLGKLPLCACPVLLTNSAGAYTRACKRTRFYLLSTRHASAQIRKAGADLHAVRSVSLQKMLEGLREIFRRKSVFYNELHGGKETVNPINIFGFRVPTFFIWSSISGTHWEIQLSPWLQN